jgi:hypothetical protein
VSNWLAITFAGLSALGGLSGVLGFFYARANRNEINARARKQKVEADVLMEQEWRDRYEWVADQAKTATREAATCRRHIDALEGHVQILNTIIRTMGGDPPDFVPPVDGADTHAP